MSGVIVICGVGNSPSLVEAISNLRSVAAVVVVDEPQTSVDPLAVKLDTALSILNEYPVEPYMFIRERGYPTLREGIRRKTIKSLNNRRR